MDFLVFSKAISASTFCKLLLVLRFSDTDFSCFSICSGIVGQLGKLCVCTTCNMQEMQKFSCIFCGIKGDFSKFSFKMKF